MPTTSSTGQDDLIITDAGQRPALVALRSIGEEGLSVSAVDSNPRSPAFASRWCAKSAVVPDYAYEPDAFIDGVLKVCAERRPRALIPVHDGSIEALRARRADVERAVGLALADEDALSIAVSKVETLKIAEELGMRTPRGVVVSRPDQAAAALDEAGLPAVVKPVRSWVHAGRAGHRLTSKVASRRVDALAAIEAVLSERTDAVVQEWLPGAREAISLLWAHGRVWARFAQRADRTEPPLGGNSVRRESIPLPADLVQQAERLVAEI